MGLTTSITAKGQVTIPVEIRRFLGLGPHDKVTFAVIDGQVRILPATSVVAKTAGVLRTDLPPLSPQEEKLLAEAVMAEEADK